MTPDQKIELSGTLASLAAFLAKDATVADVHVSATGKKPKPVAFAVDDETDGEDDDVQAELDEIFKFNENHDDKGQFSEGGGGGSGGGTGYSASMSGKSGDELQFIMGRAKEIAQNPGNRSAKTVQAAVAMGAAAAAEVSRRRSMGKSADWSLPFEITKADIAQRKVWGWASVAQVGAEVIIDKQGDIIPIGELEKAAYDFMLYVRDMGDMHSKTGVGVPFESMVFTPEKAALGIMAKNTDGKNIYGWWAGWQINNDDVWKDFAAGRRPEFSIGGKSGWTEQAAA